MVRHGLLSDSVGVVELLDLSQRLRDFCEQRFDMSELLLNLWRKVRALADLRGSFRGRRFERVDLGLSGDEGFHRSASRAELFPAPRSNCED